jgi:hypothetical protein
MPSRNVPDGATWLRPARCVEDTVGGYGRWWALGTISLVLLLGSGTSGGRAPAQAPTLLAGKDWKGFGPKEKEAYLAGFIAGAAVVRSDPARANADTTPSRQIDALRAAKQLPFPYSVSVYASQIDDYYWWANHLDVPIVDVMVRTSLQLRSR